jgi:(p)ppGpp synthase/HD superfamily hydrolase
MINISLDVERALEDAVKWHHGQFRKRSPLPYVTHVIEVMKKVYTYIHDSKSDRHMIDMLIASALHDVVEDCNVELSEIEKQYGKLVAKWVDEMSRPESDGKTFQDKYEWLKGFKDKSDESIIIKIADRYVNVMDYHRDPKKVVYSSKYALQAYPLYHEFIKRDIEYSSLIYKDLAKLSNIIRDIYPVQILFADETSRKDIENILI